jgi:Rrf2 family protein
MFSKACEYAIKATLQIAQQSQQGKRASLKDIAKAIDSPEAFTAKILQQLARQGLIQSIKGPNGGFELNTGESNSLMLSQIVQAIDGDQIYKGCGLGLKKCNELKPCPVHNKFKAIREDLSNMLENTSVHELAIGINAGLTFLKV